MGLKDLLFGKKEDANKVAYREEVKKAVSGGKLTADKVAHLEKLKDKLDVPAASQDFTMVRREQYQSAADAMMAHGKLTEAEEKELQRIQQFLGLKDTQLAQTKLDLGRLRIIMKGGKISSFTYDKPEEINLYKDGVRLRMGKGRALLFKFRSIESADFIGLLIAKGLNPGMFGPGGDATRSLNFV